MNNATYRSNRQNFYTTLGALATNKLVLIHVECQGWGWDSILATVPGTDPNMLFILGEMDEKLPGLDPSAWETLDWELLHKKVAEWIATQQQKADELTELPTYTPALFQIKIDEVTWLMWNELKAEWQHVTSEEDAFYHLSVKPIGPAKLVNETTLKVKRLAVQKELDKEESVLKQRIALVTETQTRVDALQAQLSEIENTLAQ